MSSAKEPGASAASVRARLTTVSRERGAEFQLILAEFAVERLLFRLGRSPYADRFVLKGAMLFKLWTDTAPRATWDVDLLGRGESSVREIVQIIRELCQMPVADAIVFDADSVAGEEIRGADEFSGVRVRLTATLAGARIPMQVDVGFGDAMVPPPERQDYPVLLGHEPPRILTYARETVIAEKAEAMVSLGVTNSRMKDFYDVQRLARAFRFEGKSLVEALRATFARRDTPLPAERPLALTPEFLGAPERQTQWRAFLRRGRLSASPETTVLAEELWGFLGPVFAAARGEPTPTHWPTGGPWS